MPTVTSTKKHLSATVYYLLVGLAFGWAGLLATGYLSSEWSSGSISSNLSLATIHALILGSMLTVAFGVLYQIVPIAFRAKPLPRHVLLWHLPLHCIAVVVMTSGFLWTRFSIVGIGGCLLVCNTIAYFIFLVRSYMRAQNKTVVHKGLLLPFISLFIVFLLGIFQALFTRETRPSVTLTHVMVGGFAFWGGLTLILSYKLVPMFSLSHGYVASLKRTVSLYYTGVAISIIATWLSNEPAQIITSDIGRLCILLGVVSYAIDMTSIIRARKRRKMVVPMFYACVSMFLFVIGQMGIVFAGALHNIHWFYASIYLFAFGGLIGLMFSYMQKIVPFLWFEYRFSKHPDRKNAPPIDNMVPKPLAHASMSLYFLGVLAGFAGMLQHDHVRRSILFSWGSAGSLTLGSVLLCLAFTRVLRIGGKRAETDLRDAQV